ncbi:MULTISPECIES: hypothetical protein [Trichocoleus]|uniref:hypothetical protein n=1 Tax=Trichocoleus TaxID=450526 RepID=UPI0016837BE2|nr:hypothetical protein [Trichocoleus sp. FACHB-46]
MNTLTSPVTSGLNSVYWFSISLISVINQASIAVSLFPNCVRQEQYFDRSTVICHSAVQLMFQKFVLSTKTIASVPKSVLER